MRPIPRRNRTVFLGTTAVKETRQSHCTETRNPKYGYNSRLFINRTGKLGVAGVTNDGGIRAAQRCWWQADVTNVSTHDHTILQRYKTTEVVYHQICEGIFLC